MKRARLKKLRDMRLQKHITQKTMAEKLGVSPQFYSQIERGINVLSYENALLISNFLGTSTDYLFKDEFDFQYQLKREKYWNQQ